MNKTTSIVKLPFRDSDELYSDSMLAAMREVLSAASTQMQNIVARSFAAGIDRAHRRGKWVDAGLLLPTGIESEYVRATIGIYRVFSEMMAGHKEIEISDFLQHYYLPDGETGDSVKVIAGDGAPSKMYIKGADAVIETMKHLYVRNMRYFFLWVVMLTSGRVEVEIGNLSAYDFLFNPGLGKLTNEIMKGLVTYQAAMVQEYLTHKNYIDLLWNMFSNGAPLNALPLFNLAVYALVPKKKYLKPGVYGGFPIFPPQIPFLLEVVLGRVPDYSGDSGHTPGIIYAARLMFEQVVQQELFIDDDGVPWAAPINLSRVNSDEVKREVFGEEIAEKAVQVFQMSWVYIKNGDIGKIILTTLHAIMPSGVIISKFAK